MPNLSELTDYNPQDQVTPQGRLYVSPSIPTSDDGDYFTKPVAPMPELPADNVVERIIKKLAETDFSGGTDIGNKLTGSGGQERYQLWPEKIVRSALTAIPDAYSGKIPMNDVDPETGELVPSQAMIGRALDMASFAGVGGVAGTGEGGAVLGAGPSLRPALKYKDRLYKGKEGQQHQDVIPPHLYPEFQQMAMNGEDISHYNFGFVNDKGHFLNREDALKYGIDSGLIDPQAGKFGALTSTLMADSSKPGTAIESLAKTWKVKGHENDNWFHGTTHDFDKFKVSKGNIENFGGQYPHFTNNANDASVNYAGHGPDLTGRIEKKAEEIMNEKDHDLQWNSPEYKKAYEEAKAKAAKEIAGPHDGAIIPANIKMENPADITPNGKTWIDFNPKLYKDGEWIKDHPNMTKLLNSLKKQGEKYGFDGQKAFDEVAENANLYEGDIKASDLHKALQHSEELMYAEHPNGKGMIGSHVAATVFKDLGFDGIVMDAKSAFPNMKNIEEGTKHAIVLKPQRVQSKLTGKTLFADSSKPGTAIEAMAKTAQPFYSALEHNVNAISQNKMNGEAWLGTLANKPGVKPEELDWTGLKSFLEENKGKPVTKEQVQEHLANNKVELKEVSKGELSDRDILAQSKIRQEDWDNMSQSQKELIKSGFPVDKTKYHSYQLPGGENYREMLMTLPKNSLEPIRNKIQANNGRIQELRDTMHGTSGTNEIRAEISKLQNENVALKSELSTTQSSEYRSSHWDEPNILAHVRMNDRTIDSKKSLHLEEIQSDWHQQGRDKGYAQGGLKPAEKEEMMNLAELGNKRTEAQNEKYNFLRTREYGKESGVPDAPFKKTWHELALKRMLREAAEKGYDRLSWTPGEAQAARYDLSKSVDSLLLDPKKDGSFKLIGRKNGLNAIEQDVTADKLPDIVGKEAAKNLLAADKNKYGMHELSGQQLKIGGEGMKGFYDQIIPKALEKIGKEHGVKVKSHMLETNPKGWHITPPSETVSGKWMVKSNDYNSKGYHFDTKAEAEANLAQNIAGERAAQPIHYIDIPQSLKDRALNRGFPLFSGGYVYTPVNGDPFKDKK